MPDTIPPLAADARAIAAAAADQAIARLFDRLNIDVADREELRRFGRDLLYLRALREAAEAGAARRRTAFWTGMASAVVSAFGVLLAWLINHTKAVP